MKFNFGHLTKISSNPQYSVLRHPDGHEIKISHAHLSPEMRSQLEKVPKAFQQGGDTTPDQSPYGEEEIQAQQAANEAPSMEDTNQPPQDQNQPVPQTTPVPEQPDNTNQQIAEATQVPSVGELPKDIFGAGTQAQQYTKGLRQFQQGAGQEAKAEIEYQNLMRPTYEAQSQIINQQANMSLNIQKQNQERANALQDSLYTKDPVTGKLIPPHIDPNQYWEDKSIPGKISTIIGLIAGGIGGGILHQENPAMKMLNQQIDRNMLAQNMNIDNKMSLLNANRDFLQNEAAAQGMTRVILNDQVVNAASQAMAKTNDQLVIGRLKQLVGNKNMESSQILAQNAALMSMTGESQLPGGQQPQGQNFATQNPEAMITAWTQKRPNEKEPLMKELEEARMMAKFKDNVLSSFDQARDLVRSSNVMNPQLGERLDAINSPVLASLSKDTAGRFTDTDSRYLSPLQVNRMDKIKPGSEEQTWNLKRNKLNQLVNTKMNFPRLKFLGIDPDAFGTYDKMGNRKFSRLPPKITKQVKPGSFGTSGTY